MSALAALFVVWTAVYAAQSYAQWSAVNPATRLGFMPTAKKATEPVGGHIRWRRLTVLTSFACSFGGSAYNYSAGVRGHLYLAAICGIGVAIPTLIVLAILTIRHNRRVRILQSSEVQRRPLPTRAGSNLPSGGT